MENKQTIVLIGIYLEGIYPRGQNQVVADLLAPAVLKAAVEADPKIKQNYNVEIVNLPSSNSAQQIVNHIIQFHPIAVGFSSYIWNAELMHECSLLLKSQQQDCLVIFGGPEVSHDAESILKGNNHIDFIVAGNGESRLRALLWHEFIAENINEFKGIYYRDKKGSIVQTDSESAYDEDLSQIPSPFKNNIIDLNDGHEHCVFVETFRGCIFECGYCMWMGAKNNKELNLFPLDQILDDVEIIYNNPNVKAVVFTDACIFYTRDRAKQILDKIASCRYKIPTILTLDIAFINEEAIEALSLLDLSHQKFHFGMQSVNQETMKLMKRRIGPELFKKRMELIYQVDPDAEISFDLIYGLPGDNFLTFRETVNFSLNLNPVKLNLSPLVLLPGSAYWADKEKHGFHYDHTPPYLVHSNNSYSLEDMSKTRKLVLSVIMVMYFPVILKTIYKLTENKAIEEIDKTVQNNNFNNDTSIISFPNTPNLNGNNISRLELIESFVFRFEQRSAITFDDPWNEKSENYTIIDINNVRKELMDQVAAPKNCLIAYQVMKEILAEQNTLNLVDEIMIGIDYYSEVINSSHSSAYISFCQKYSKGLIDKIKFGWVVSSEHMLSPVIPKTDKGGIAAIC